jgi:REP element-mobilizing transposase RayT
MFWLDLLQRVCERFHFVIHAYCQMGNHYHLVVETIEGNLAQGMRQLNSIYSQEFNRRNGLVGHVFQGRYRAVLVQKDSYLLELSRYVVLNPVRAHLVSGPQNWAWSSYNATMGINCAPECLDIDWILSQFGKDRESARQAYQAFVLAGVGQSSPLAATRHQLMLGGNDFVEQHRQQFAEANFTAISRDQRRLAAKTLPEYQAEYEDRDAAMFRAYASTAFTMVDIAAHFGVSTKTVSRAVHKYEEKSRR